MKVLGFIKKNFQWLCTIIFALAALGGLPSISSIFWGILAIVIAPIAPIRSFINNILPNKKGIKAVLIAVLFILGGVFAPESETAPQKPNIQDTIVVETSSETIETTATVIPTTENKEITITETNPEETETLTEEETTTEAETTVEETTVAETTAVVMTKDSYFQIHFIDVGQADAALITCDGHSMLIDGGNKEDSSLIYSVLKKAEIKKLDLVVGTHAHEDHIGGLPGAFNYTTADITLCPVTSYDSNAFEDFANYAEKNGGSITVPRRGDTYSLGSASVTILGVNGGSDTNDTSIVLRIDYGKTSFLFTGDAERDAEQSLLNSGADLSATVLKVGHHGSDTSTTYPFLREIMPKYAVISVGEDNSYGHPTEDALSRLRDADVTVFRTDLQGDIICTSDGENVTFEVERNKDADVFAVIGSNSTQKEETSAETAEETEEKTKEETTAEKKGTDYLLNKNSKKFHYMSCGNGQKTKEGNRKYFTGTREEVIAMGYEPCKNCNP